MARYAPGIPKADLEKMTRPETTLVRKLVNEDLDAEEKMRVEHTKAMVKAALRSPF